MTETNLYNRFRQGTLIGNPSENMRLFLENGPPGVADQFVTLLETINRTDRVEYRFKCLVRVILSMALDHEMGVRSWSLAAMRAGATRAEIIELMYAVIPQLGAIPIIRMLPEVLALEDMPPDGTAAADASG